MYVKSDFNEAGLTQALTLFKTFTLHFVIYLCQHYFLDTFDFSRLNPKNRRGNFELAFKVAE